MDKHSLMGMNVNIFCKGESYFTNTMEFYDSVTVWVCVVVIW